MCLVVDPKLEIGKRIMSSTSLPKEQLLREIICNAANYYAEFINEIQLTNGWCWATWITENGLINPIDIFCEAASKVAEKYDCLNDEINIESELKLKVKEIREKSNDSIVKEV